MHQISYADEQAVEFKLSWDLHSLSVEIISLV